LFLLQLTSSGPAATPRASLRRYSPLGLGRTLQKSEGSAFDKEVLIPENILETVVNIQVVAVDEVEDEGKKAPRSSSCHGGGSCDDNIGDNGMWVIVLLLKVMLGRSGSAEPVVEPIADAHEVVKVGDNDDLSDLRKHRRKEPVGTSVLQERRRGVDDVQ
jgi:hypothetical protein